MKTLNFNKNSWHYRLVSVFGLYKEPCRYYWGNGDSYMAGDSGDICTYSKRVILALLIVSTLTAAIVGNLIIVIESLLGVYFSILMGQWFFSELGNFGIFLWFGIFFCVYMVKLSNKISTYKEKLQEQKYKDRDEPKMPDSFIKHAYKAWKNKFCIPINFVE